MVADVAALDALFEASIAFDEAVEAEFAALVSDAAAFNADVFASLAFVVAVEALLEADVALVEALVAEFAALVADVAACVADVAA